MADSFFNNSPERQKFYQLQLEVTYKYPGAKKKAFNRLEQNPMGIKKPHPLWNISRDVQVSH